PLEARGPCPMLNTLANHEFLPHNGRAFTVDIIKTALKTALNINEDLGEHLHNQALATSPVANATTWGLDTLSRHNILEHDASLSRSDHFFTNDAVTFNATVFDQTRKWWPNDIIDVQQVADARLGRMIDSVKYNQKFTLSELAGAFKNEHLPVELGWKPPNPAITRTELLNLADSIINATVYKAESMGKLMR
ncbi:Cloroperoxidase, partial [Byssothecium circinans]